MPTENVSISGLPAGITVSSSDIIPLVQAGLTRRSTVGALSDAVKGGSGASVTSTSHVPGLSDANKYIRLTSASAATVTLPTNAAAGFPLWTTITYEQTGAGAITFVEAGVQINKAATHQRVTNGQYSVVSVTKVGTNEWTLYGNLEPV